MHSKSLSVVFKHRALTGGPKRQTVNFMLHYRDVWPKSNQFPWQRWTKSRKKAASQHIISNKPDRVVTLNDSKGSCICLSPVQALSMLLLSLWIHLWISSVVSRKPCFLGVFHPHCLLELFSSTKSHWVYKPHLRIDTMSSSRWPKLNQW